MFYCDYCRKDKGWPIGLVTSYGRCEECGNVDNCHDVPSSSLAIPRKPEKVAKINGLLDWLDIKTDIS